MGGSTRWTFRQARSVGLILVLALIAIGIAILKPQSKPRDSAAVVIGQVVDSLGQPVSGAEVGTSFQLAQTAGETKVQISYADPPVRTDAQGRFSMPAAPISYTKAVVAKKDGLLGFAIRKDGEGTVIRLAEPAQLNVALNKKFGSSGATGADLMKNGSALAYGKIMGKAAFAVPQGAFDLLLAEPEIVQTTLPLVLTGTASQAVVVQLKPTSWAMNVGKPAPAFDPTDLHNAQSVGPASLRGKWVLVDFWATWCLPCVQEMPKLIAFYSAHAKDRDRFEIVAVHSPDGKSFHEIQPAYRSLVARSWSGKELPFPLVFDSRGITQKNWGIEAYPTTLLIDPRGRLVGAATIDDLAKRI